MVTKGGWQSKDGGVALLSGVIWADIFRSSHSCVGLLGARSDVFLLTHWVGFSPRDAVMTTILLVALASLAVYTAALRRRHRCTHNDPLCRRERPCIACYRELFDSVGFSAVGQVSDLPRTVRKFELFRWR